MTNLAMGANVPITSPEFTLDVHCSSSVAMDVTALQLYSGGKVRGDNDMCFFNQTSIADGAISLEQTTEHLRFSFKLDKLNPEVEKIVVNATLDNGAFSAVNDLKLSTSTGINMAVDTASRSEAALILCEVYKRNGQWKIRNVSQGFNGGLQALAEHFGVDVDTPSDSPGSTSTTTSTSHTASTDAAAAAQQPDASHRPATASNVASAEVHNTSGAQAPAPLSSSTASSGSGMMNRLKQTAAQARSKLSAEAGKFKNRTFMEAVVNGCVLVAAADGSIDASEKQKMAGFIERAQELQHFDMREVIDIFQSAAADIEFDSVVGKASALRKIGKIKSNQEQARLLVRVVCAIGAADGDFDAQEKDMVRQIASELGLDSTDFL